MRIEHAARDIGKGWYAGPWNSNLNVSVGYANQGIDEPHIHTSITEIYLIAQGSAHMRIEQETITLAEGDMVVVEPGEAHTFLDSSAGYSHLVVHTPGLPGNEGRSDKQPVPRNRLES